MTKMTLEIHKFIVENQHINNPLLANLVETKYGESFTRQHIGRTKTKPLEHNIVQESSKNIPRKNNGGTKRGTKKFHLTYSGFLQLCKKNPHHPFSQYFLERNQPPKYPGRAELMKFLQLLEDCYRM